MPADRRPPADRVPRAERQPAHRGPGRVIAGYRPGGGMHEPWPGSRCHEPPNLPQPGRDGTSGASRGVRTARGALTKTTGVGYLANSDRPRLWSRPRASSRASSTRRRCATAPLHADLPGQGARASPAQFPGELLGPPTDQPPGGRAVENRPEFGPSQPRRSWISRVATPGSGGHSGSCPKGPMDRSLETAGACSGRLGPGSTVPPGISLSGSRASGAAVSGAAAGPARRCAAIAPAPRRSPRRSLPAAISTAAVTAGLARPGAVASVLSGACRSSIVRPGAQPSVRAAPYPPCTGAIADRYLARSIDRRLRVSTARRLDPGRDATARLPATRALTRGDAARHAPAASDRLPPGVAAAPPAQPCPPPTPRGPRVRGRTVDNERRSDRRSAPSSWITP